MKQKQGQTSQALPTFHGGSGPSTTKKRTKLFRMPSSCVRSLRDAYVSFMMSIASKGNVNMAAVAYTTWPCAGVVPARHPGRSPRVEISDEEMACSSFVLENPSTATAKGMTQSTKRSPMCARNAVFPL
ncbi:unnamed protein product [Calypogeia fissa]